jgi:hypothetical protein
MNSEKIMKVVSAVLIILTLLLVMVTYQYSEYAGQCEQAAEHAELIYLRAWKNAHPDTIKVETQGECIQDAFKMLRPFLMPPFGNAMPQLPTIPPPEDARPKKGTNIA